MHDHNRYAELTNEQLADQLDTLVGNTTLLKEASARLRKTTDFETELDGMYEATEEFILDDTDYDGSPRQLLDELIHNNKVGVADRVKDLQAIARVRDLYEAAFKPQED